MSGHEFYWWSHGCKHDDPKHEGPHVCECGHVYEPDMHSYGHDADEERRDALMRKHGYNPDLPPRGVAGGPGEFDGSVIGDSGRLVPGKLRNNVCELEDFEIDGHSDPDRTGFCVYCSAPIEGEPFRLTFRVQGPVRRSEQPPDAGALPGHGGPSPHLPRAPAHRTPVGSRGPLAHHGHQAEAVPPRRRPAVVRGAVHRACGTAPGQTIRRAAISLPAQIILTAVRKQMDRELDPATPPWLTVRMWLTIAALACPVTALCLSALRE